MNNTVLNYCVFDIETQNWFTDLPPGSDHSKLKISVLGAYFSKEDVYIAYLEKDLEAFVEKLKTVDLVIGYNSIGFDLPVLQPYTDLDLKTLPSYDILLEIEKQVGFKVKLDDVAKATLGINKTDKGSNAILYFREGNWSKLIDYCMWDVRITKEVFETALNSGVLKYKDFIDQKEVKVNAPNFNLPKNLRYFEKGIF
jgi:DEAD/DEAH box helicase domain-containing protein